ncbi:MAG: UDP-N-acetylmuramate dehydrogenase [Chloroflexi bacterium]|nr:UDP-N-acetylmuramate dehydrogenase [Chloroflexota bacterium]MCY3582227.1 UDP-N-acetylmuramate dehydrogenase [Chloroflexota bacterium]MCY3715033.1 UDP-N-acetylmuramate dehydrogenase [Chloroflexota bacterium]MDE2650559.1 UDP-N-acetylmuramate dehydrogenase [Chloroflexota bacterium]
MSDTLLQAFPCLRRDQSLARYTAARLGGPADYLYIAKDPAYTEAKRLLSAAWALELPVTVIGGGANILVADAGIRGLVIVNRAARIEPVGTRVLTAAGTSLIHLARACHEYALTGMEWAIAVPGTVGGAVVNNAGAHGGDIASNLLRARIFAPGGTNWLAAEELDYAYRHSLLKARVDRRFFVLAAELALQSADGDEVGAKMARNNAYRRRTQPPGASLGSIFKNPPGDFAGRLIEAAGLKGQRIGGVQVSPRHANFFVNLGGAAQARDYRRLILLVQERVKRATGITLELEVQLLGDWQEKDALDNLRYCNEKCKL